MCVCESNNGSGNIQLSSINNVYVSHIFFVSVNFATDECCRHHKALVILLFIYQFSDETGMSRRCRQNSNTFTDQS